MRYVLALLALLFLVVFPGCKKLTVAQAEADAKMALQDLQIASDVITKAMPTVTAVAEIVAPKSTTTANLAMATGKITMANGILQGITLNFPPAAAATSTTGTVITTLQAGSSLLAQLTPAAKAIAEATAPGSTAAVDLTKATAVITTVNGAITSAVLTLPQAAPVPAPVTPAASQ